MKKKHKKFEAKYDLPFALIADPAHKIIDKYGVWGEKQLYGRKYMGIHRTSFLINEKGIIKKIILRPKIRPTPKRLLHSGSKSNRVYSLQKDMVNFMAGRRK